MLDKFDGVIFGVEDEDGADLGVSDVQPALGIDGQPVRRNELKARLVTATFGGIRRYTREAIHPGTLHLLLASLGNLRHLGGEKIQIAQPRNGRSEEHTSELQS